LSDSAPPTGSAPLPASYPFHRMRRRLLALGSLLLIVLLVAAAAYDYAAWRSRTQAYQATVSQIQAELDRSSQSGYSSAQLTTARRQIDQLSTTPLWRQLLPSSNLAAQAAAVERNLQAADAAQLQAALATADSALSGLTLQQSAAQQAGVPAELLTPLQTQLTALRAERAAASTPDAIQMVVAKAATLKTQYSSVMAAQTAANTAIQQAASTLLAQAAGNLSAITSAGQQARAGGRNSATIAAYEAEPGRFPKIAQMMQIYDEMESYDSDLASSDLNTAAKGAAAMGYYSALIQQLLLQNLGPQHLVVSFAAQHVWAYQNGAVVMDSAVTTGVRGVTDVGTDFGAMKILVKSSPWTFVSPWPKGSPLWYPNTRVQFSSFFTNTGESFHDASWEPNYLLGPGSQYNRSTESHGCVHVPLSVAGWIFHWANVGTPVDVYPGDGAPVATQLTEITTNTQGVPLNHS